MRDVIEEVCRVALYWPAVGVRSTAPHQLKSGNGLGLAFVLYLETTHRQIRYIVAALIPHNNRDDNLRLAGGPETAIGVSAPLSRGQ